MADFTITKSCPVCKKVYTPDLCKTPDFQSRLIGWQSGRVLIQAAFPDATANQREQLMTGICSNECWKSLWPEEGDEDDSD